MVAATNERNGGKWQTLKTPYRYSPEILPARCFHSLPPLNKFSMTRATPEQGDGLATRIVGRAWLERVFQLARLSQKML